VTDIIHSMGGSEMNQLDTPAVGACGATTVWANGPAGPPEIADRLVDLVRDVATEKELTLYDLDVTVRLKDGYVLKQITYASQKGSSVELHTTNTVYLVDTTDIIRLRYTLMGTQ